MEHFRSRHPDLLDDVYTIANIDYDEYTLTYSFETLNSGTITGSFVGVLQPVQDNSD